MAELWHNPRCSKSRQTLALIEEKGVEVQILKYLETPPSREQLAAAIEKLGDAHLLVRKKEAEYKEQGLSAESSTEEILDALVAVPKLMERPVFINDKGVALGRPPENVLALL